MGGSTAIAMGKRLGIVACGCACPVHTPKPSSWPCVKGPAASITTSKVAASFGWRASSAAYSSAWSWQASSSSISARGGYSACPAGAFPRALELMPGSATWPLGQPTQMPAIASIVAGGTGASSGAETPVGRLPQVHLCIQLLDIFFHWPLHRPPLLLCLHLILV